MLWKDYLQKVTFILIFVLLFSLNISAVEIVDISEEDPVYDTVEELVEQGVMNLTEEGEFSGEETVTHYQLAEVVEEILARIETGQIQISEDEIRELSLELREDVSELNSRQQEILEIVEHIVRENVVFKEELGRYEELTIEFEEDINIFREDMDYFAERVESAEEIALGFDEKLQNLQNQQQSYEKLLEQIKNSHNEIKDYLDLSEEDLRTQVDELEYKIKDMTDLYNEMDSNLEVMKENFSQLNEKIDEEQIAKFGELQEEFDERLIEIQDEYSLELTALQTRLNSRIDDLRQTNEEQEKEIQELKSKNSTLQLSIIGVGVLSILALLM